MKTLTIARRIFAFAILASLPTLSQAHFIWAKLDGATHKLVLRIEERPGEETLPMGEKLTPLSTLLYPSKVSSAATKTDVELSFLGDRNLALAKVAYGLFTREGKASNLVYYAKAADSTADAGRVVGKGFELVATLKGNTWSVQAFVDGRAAKDATVVFDGEEGAKAENMGKARELTVTENKPLNIRGVRTVAKPGMLGDKAYSETREWTTLVLPAVPVVTTGSNEDAYRAIQSATESREALKVGSPAWSMPFSATNEKEILKGQVDWDGKTFKFTMDETNAHAKHVKSQLQSLFFHRLDGDFAAGEGKYAITESKDDKGSIFRIGDKMDSTYRLKNGRFSEVSRTLGGSRLVLNIDSWKVVDGKRVISAGFTSTSYKPNSNEAKSVLRYTDAFQPFNGEWLPAKRTVKGTTDGHPVLMEVSFGRPVSGS